MQYFLKESIFFYNFSFAMEKKMFWKDYKSKILCMCAMIWIFMSPSQIIKKQTSYDENLMPKMMLLGAGAFGKWLGHGVTALMNGISALTRETQKPGLFLPPCEETARSINPEDSPSLAMLLPWSQNSSLQTNEKWSAALYKPPRLCCIVTAAWSDWDGIPS